MISREANDLIIASEVGSKALYEKKYRRPEWPGGRSGVTVGIGYDLGYATEAKIKNDWGPLLAGQMVDAMLECAGISGDAARKLLPSVRNRIDVPWDAGIHVYETIDIPEWERRVCAAIPGADRLHPHCRGALTSLSYNRGLSYQAAGDRYREMRAIRSHVMAHELDLVDDEIRSMARLWPGPNERGLPIRRNKEADLWNKGLEAVRSGKTYELPAKPVANPVPPPLVPPKEPGGASESAAGGVATGTAAGMAQHFGLSPEIMTGIVVGGIVVTVGVVAYLRWKRSQPVLARAKG